VTSGEAVASFAEHFVLFLRTKTCSQQRLGDKTTGKFLPNRSSKKLAHFGFGRKQNAHLMQQLASRAPDLPLFIVY
jgi:hypothetical protein